MILELDCGNTRIKWRVRDGVHIVMRGMLLTHEVFNFDIVAQLARIKIERILIGCVLGDVYAHKLMVWSVAHFGVSPEFATSTAFCSGVTNGYQEPEKLGVDRWLAIIAAKAQGEFPCVIVDCGSAITVDLVTSQGRHLGGYIAPGLSLMRKALGVNTAGVKLGQIGYPEDLSPGCNTVDGVKSAELAMLIGLVDHAKTILSQHEVKEVVLLLTGGDGEWLASKIAGGIYQEDLVLDGLCLAFASKQILRGKNK